MALQMNIIKLRESLYLLDEGGISTGYLIIGEEKACLIDTMNGENDLAKLVGELTDKPVIVVNTHGHPDHIYGNIFFKETFMHPADFDLADQYFSEPDFVELMHGYGLRVPPVSVIKEGDIIKLGGRSLKVIECPGHTPGGILLLCPEERILFTGDSINHHLWMQLECCDTITEYVDTLEKLLYLTDEADFILHGHARGFDDISLFPTMLAGLKEIVAGENERDKKYLYFDGQAEAIYHPFKVEGEDENNDMTSIICYRPENVRE